MNLLKIEGDVELWHLPHESGEVEVFFVKDPRRTPEDWTFSNRAEAEAKFGERVERAKTHPPIRPR